ncbi:MAG: hypothetical protein JOZ90_17310 [Alphaproteobacteria bacterium]|nr:hypothetical protein [Alphaproteobacteria bacterium]MBV9371231.1 hypothetical protein [Alphaproteobacteria bacterium]MBV9902830.1 hypothetical protein [Alphaproteobacteria bacterium]
MSREPTYPEDAKVGPPSPEPAAPAAAAPAKAADPRRSKYLATGAAIGIGSAAIVAALLYANRNRRG